jgi:hypothetical protein
MTTFCVSLLCFDAVIYAAMGLRLLSLLWLAAAVAIVLYQRWQGIANARIPQRRRRNERYS